MANKQWKVAEPSGGGLRQMSSLECAYLAGLVDGEGTISVYAQKRKGGRSNLSHGLVEHLGIPNTDLRLIEKAQAITGVGTIYARDQCDGTKVCYTWPLYSQTAVGVLKQIVPYLVGKQRQAQLALEVSEIRERRRQGNWIAYTDEDLERLNALFVEIGEANGSKREGVLLSQFATPKVGRPRNDVQIKRTGVAHPPRPPIKLCEVEGCSERVADGAGGYCPAHWAEMQQELHRHTCQRCGAEYEAKRTDQKFCSTECQARTAYERRPKDDQRTAICQGCGAKFEHNNANRDFCGRPCYMKWRRAQQRAAQPETVDQRRCVRCNEAFETSNAQKVFCGPKCAQATGQERRKATEKAQREPGTCPECGATVDRTGYKSKVFCGEPCAQRYRLKQVRAARHPLPERPCPHCGVAFVPNSGKQQFCGDSCNKAAWYSRKKGET